MTLLVAILIRKDLKLCHKRASFEHPNVVADEKSDFGKRSRKVLSKIGASFVSFVRALNISLSILIRCLGLRDEN